MKLKDLDMPLQDKNGLPKMPFISDAVRAKAQKIKDEGGEPRFFQRSGRMCVMDTKRIGKSK